MSHYDYEEISGKNGRNSTTLLMKSLQQILKESGADKYLMDSKTVPPRNVQAMSPQMAETKTTVPPQTATAQPVPPAHAAVSQRAQLDRPVCLQGSERKGLFARLFG